MAVFNLIADCPPLDTNSSYCNFLQCTHFTQTSVATLQNDKLLGFVSAYVIPDKPNTLFIWQVAVSSEARGLGLASQMLNHLLERPQCLHIEYIETTITEDNTPSWSLFKRLAEKWTAPLTSSPWVDKEDHFASQHESETLVRIGPLQHN
jgi:L-2,4-diaminobutyric acid acetyltransferase